MVERQWTWTTPVSPGWYWFCGTLWGSRVEMVPVRVRRGGNCIIYVTGGAFLYPKSGEGIGVWMKMNVPDPPIRKVTGRSTR